jgi:hypothetical protein
MANGETIFCPAHAPNWGREFGLADTLKLSVHSGSDKFSIYPIRIAAGMPF